MTSAVEVSMSSHFIPQVVAAQIDDGRPVWLTADDRWSGNPREAEILDEEAHAAIRLIDGRLSLGRGREVRLVPLDLIDPPG